MIRILLAGTVIVFAAVMLFFSLRTDISSTALRTPIAESNKTENLHEPSAFAPIPPTLQTIFATDHQWTATLSAHHLRTVLATGDVIPARSVNIQVMNHHDFTWPYQKTMTVTRDADITFINLETPLLDTCDATDGGMVFCGNSRHVEGLVFAGVDIANLANNHAGNYGADGVTHTKALLEQHGIRTTGTGQATIVTVDGIRFAFLGYNDITPQPGVQSAEGEMIRSDIVKAHTQADVVVVTYHWGVEYRDQPDERQRFLGHLTIDAGADLVIGNHPHWIQPVELYRGKLITYAHGNFVFDQMWSEKTRLGVIGKYTFYDRQLIDTRYIPVRIDSYGQPILLSPEAAAPILEDMKQQSAILAARDTPAYPAY